MIKFALVLPMNLINFPDLGSIVHMMNFHKDTWEHPSMAVIQVLIGFLPWNEISHVGNQPKNKKLIIQWWALLFSSLEP
jgi:hypothetical protein